MHSIAFSHQHRLPWLQRLGVYGAVLLVHGAFFWGLQSSEPHAANDKTATPVWVEWHEAPSPKKSLSELDATKAQPPAKLTAIREPAHETGPAHRTQAAKATQAPPVSPRSPEHLKSEPSVSTTLAITTQPAAQQGGNAEQPPTLPEQHANPNPSPPNSLGVEQTAIKDAPGGHVQSPTSLSASSTGTQQTTSLDPQPLGGADHQPKPTYPSLSQRKGEEGTVWVLAQVGENGAVTAVAIKTSSGFDRLDKAALQTVRQWRFAPGKKNGTPLAMAALVPVKFELTER